jgi:MSHA biogenesis protein MshQ
LLLLLVIGCVTSLAHADTQTADPSTCTGSGTGSAWSNAARAVGSDNSYATASVDGTTTAYLACTGYGFSIPTDATINGVTVNVERKSSSTSNGGSLDAAMQLVKAGLIVATATNDRATSTIYGTTDAIEAHGGNTDLWSTALAPSDINNVTFGAALKATKPSSSGGAQTISIDNISILINYTTLPKVVSITLVGINPTNEPSVKWTVTFSENVTGVDAADFAVVSSGLAGTPQIIDVSGSGTTYTVTATTGNGGANGTLGLNLVDNDSIQSAASGVKLGGAGTGNGNFTGQVYTIDTTAPSACYSDDFTRATLGSDWVTSSSSGSFGAPKIVSNRLRLTDSTASVATVANLQRLFPGAGNKIIVEFDYFAYNGNGADGIAVTLSDASIAPAAGAFGGSLGYAQKSPPPASDCAKAAGCPGFAGGWLGVGIDEFGGYAAALEGRIGGLAANRADAVSVRGSGSGLAGYNYHVTSAVLNPGIDVTGTTAGPNHRYRITVDHSNNTNAFVTVDRDTTTAKNSYTNIIAKYDAKTMTGQKAVPPSWFLSFTGSTGGSTNTHEIGGLRVCTTQAIGIPNFDHVRIVHDDAAATCSPETVTLKACADPACNTLYLGPVTVNLTATNGATWSVNPATISAGQTQVTLSKTSAGTVNVGGVVTSVGGATTNTNAICYNGNTPNQCAIVYSANSCTFDAVEVNKDPGTPIFTKVAGIPFSLNVLALPLTSTDKRAGVLVDLVDQTGIAAGVCSNVSLISVPPIDFLASTSQNPSPGSRRQTVTFNYPNAANNVRVRMQSGGATSCSSDNFAIRPASFTISSNADNMGSGNGTTVKAGLPFELDAIPKNGAAVPADTGNYSGTAKINTNSNKALIPHTGAIQVGVLGGTFSAAVPGTPPSGTNGFSIGTAFTYSEVGNFLFQPWTIYDDSFADVDRLKATPECRTDNNLGANTANDPGDPNTLDLNGMYGCYFGAATSSAFFGRFTPDHFAVSAATMVNRSDFPSCSSTFNYAGETMATKFTLTAQNSTGNITQNYDGDFAKLTITGSGDPFKLNAVNSDTVRTPFPVCAGVSPCVTPQPASNPRTNASPPLNPFLKGVAADISLPFSILRPASPVGPYSFFNVGIAPTDSDLVTTSPYDIDTVNVTEATPKNHTKVVSTIVRYGRLTLANANGSELLNLPLGARMEYWNTTTSPPGSNSTLSRFVLNTDDSCTVIQPGSIMLRNQLLGLNSANMPANNIVSSPLSFSSGLAKLTVKKPATPPTSRGSVDVCVDLSSDNTPGTICASSGSANMPWLQGAWGGSSYDDDPVSRATFGTYKSGPVIYLREVY